ncbi:MAG: FHA domain-containing protein [Coriobacteriales bacterium]|jgi:pSer/pThr/pTyr-binding forkhead associated (FHA) protein|nr:FHA domain-containing protein [Coriobacteriales bacterium]
MIDLVLLAGRILLVVLLFLFLFAVMRTGIGLVKGQTKKGDTWTISVEHGPRELRGVRLEVTSPVIVGRSPGADIVIPATYVSGRHARFAQLGDNLIIEDLGSTNGTTVNGEAIGGAMQLLVGDTVGIGEVTLRVSRG